MDRGLYKKILIATEDSENAEQAMNARIEISRLSQGKACVLHVIDKFAYPAGRK